ncbi:MAG: sugar porter family MFS transporter [Xanthomonadales bacterium]|nr:sugar porter family MFS transporter [Gammaproteobacteria bacterium]MBT8055221.1 sugar porter family MFS transporter [Gammaproteobacteria bacterium]NND56949.1 sugar porter family MFS transporter [Xanthomonadales bacterium]NNK51907.1 sugar porter family MFS transporter [Xanthomonadales bacterium]
MAPSTRYTIRVALIVALGGFLMGFDASVISGVVTFIEPEFKLTNIELGWAVASLTLTATLAMMVAGPLSDRFGRRPVLKVAAVLFTISAAASAVAPDYITLVAARMLGGLGVGAALIIAPMYIAEIAPADIRGRMVSFNQLNIVIGISAAFFSNYLILSLGQSDLAWAQSLNLAEWNWRWMLGVEALPAIFYFFALFSVPESPRWLVMHNKDEDALEVMAQVTNRAQAEAELKEVRASLDAEAHQEQASIRELFQPAMKLVLTIGISVAILQQITGINSVFFYAPMIFEQSGIGTDASFMQAVLVGLVNLVFTVLAIAMIDRLGRRPLLGFGLAGITICMLLLSYSFGQATYTLTNDVILALPQEINTEALLPLVNQTFDSDIAFSEAVSAAIGNDVYKAQQSAIVSGSIAMNPTLILIGILGFVASFAISLGPVMWVLFSELFPNRVRGIAISFVGLINSAVSFTVQLVFPWELDNLGNSLTFLIYGAFAFIGLIVVMRLLPETKGKSLEELEAELVRR